MYLYNEAWRMDEAEEQEMGLASKSTVLLTEH